MSFAEICALIDLIEFHDDWETVSEFTGTDIDALYDKLMTMKSELVFA